VLAVLEGMVPPKGAEDDLSRIREIVPALQAELVAGGRDPDGGGARVAPSAIMTYPVRGAIAWPDPCRRYLGRVGRTDQEGPLLAPLDLQLVEHRVARDRSPARAHPGF
jgi:hypothetical protein